MTPTLGNGGATVPPPAYHRAQARLSSALHIDALTDASTPRICLLSAVWLCIWHIAAVLLYWKSGPGGAPRTYSEASLLLIALLRTLWRLSYQDMRDWLRGWPALALACGLPVDKDGRPRVPCPSQKWKRSHRAGHRCQKRCLCSPCLPPSARD